MKIEQFFLPGLGHQSYIVTDEHSRVAVVIDPRRDVDLYLQAAQHADVRISHILETHLHNDYVTGARELAAKTGATIVASALDAPLYEHMPVHDGDSFATGHLQFGVIATPGHTPEHVSYTLSEPGEAVPEALFSGGSLLVGNAGRTDLLGESMTLTLTRQQYHSLRRLLATLPGQVHVYPTHGAGSFCMATGDAQTHFTTIAQERLVSPAVLVKDEDEFIQKQLAGYIAYPTYYRFMHDINKHGPNILGDIPLPPALTPHAVQQLLNTGMALVDGRKRDDFAREHIPGSLSVELDDSFATYIGWLLPFNVPLLILIEDERGRREAVVQLMRIGYERVEGYVDGGIETWKAEALPTSNFESIDIQTLHTRWSQRAGTLTIVDVRRSDEWLGGHIPDALHLPLHDLPSHLDVLPKDQAITTICQSGYRAGIAASIVAATGRQVIAVRGGMQDWLEAGLPSSTAASSNLPAYSHNGYDDTHAHP